MVAEADMSEAEIKEEIRRMYSKTWPNILLRLLKNNSALESEVAELKKKLEAQDE